MARRYARDNRGRFSSAGATARGGRLRTAAGNKRATVTKGIAGGKPAGAIKGKVKRDPGAAGKIGASKPKATAKSANRPDSARNTAVVNIPMRGARGRALDAEITRNVNAQKAASRAASKARNRKFKSEQSRAKKLRDVHVGAIAKSKGMSKKQVESALQAQTPSTQIKALKNWVKQNRTAAKPAAAKPATKPAPKVDTSLKAVAARRARALAPRTSTYLSQKLNTQSAITRSAANAIYNRQRAVGKQLGLDQSVVRNPIGIMPQASGSIRNMAMQVREAARKRVVGGRRR